MTPNSISPPHRSLLNRHVLLDRLLIDWIGGTVSRITGSPRYFSESVKSPGFDEHLAAIRIKLPPVDGVGHHELRVETLAGEMDAAVRVRRWHSD